MLSSYRDKYYELLVNKLKELSNHKILVEECNYLIDNLNKLFILHPDYSSMINLFHNSYILKKESPVELEIYIKKFIQEVWYLKNGQQNKLSMNQGNQIWNTNIYLSNKFINPYDWLDAHPDHKNTWWVVWFWEKDIFQWLEIYEKTFKILKSVDEWFYNELNFIVSKIVPLWTARGLHNSASYKETIWSLYLWYTIDNQNPEINNLEAIIHESSHNKLNLIMQFDPIILNDAEEKYYSPYRPDARHIHWTFLGLHAFVPTIYILAKSYSENKFSNNDMWKEKILLYHLKNQICLNVINKYAKLTDLWQEILNEISEVLEMTKPFIKKINYSNNEIQFIKKVCKEHFQGVNINYPYLEY